MRLVANWKHPETDNNHLTGGGGLGVTVKPTFNGAPASAGNGTMVAFEARNQNQVRALHLAVLAAGGADEGQPGFRKLAQHIGHVAIDQGMPQMKYPQPFTRCT